jgi:hypothetical protein
LRIRWLTFEVIADILFGAGMLIIPVATRDLFSLLFYCPPGDFHAKYSAAANKYIMPAHRVIGDTMPGWGVVFMGRWVLRSGPGSGKLDRRL